MTGRYGDSWKREMGNGYDHISLSTCMNFSRVKKKIFKIHVFRDAQRFLETEHCKRVNFSFIPNVGVFQILGVDKEREIQGLLFQSVIIDGRLYHLHLKQDKQSRRGLRWDIVGQASPPLWWFE